MTTDREVRCPRCVLALFGGGFCPVPSGPLCRAHRDLPPHPTIEDYVFDALMLVADCYQLDSPKGEHMSVSVAPVKTSTPASSGFDIRQLAKTTRWSGDPNTILHGLDPDTEVQQVAAAIVADLQAFPWPARPDGIPSDRSGETWQRVRSTKIGPRQVPLDQLIHGRPKFVLFGAIRLVAGVLRHAASHRGELAQALGDLDRFLEVRR